MTAGAEKTRRQEAGDGRQGRQGSPVLPKKGFLCGAPPSASTVVRKAGRKEKRPLTQINAYSGL